MEENIWLIGAVATALLVSVVSAALAWRSLRFTAHSARCARQKMAALEQRLAVATAGAVGMGRRVLALEEKLQSVRDAQENAGGDSLMVAQAMRMFDQGANAAAVASSCGLSSSEAKLMAKIRQQLSHPPPAALDRR